MSLFKTKVKQIPGFYRKEQGAGTAGTTEKSAYTSLPSNWKQHQPPHLQDPCFLPKRKRQKRKDHHSLGQAHTFLEKEWKPLQLQRGHRPASWGQDVTCSHYDGTVTSVVFSTSPEPHLTSDRPWMGLTEKLSQSRVGSEELLHVRWGVAGPDLRRMFEGQSLYQPMNQSCFYGLDRSTMETWEAGLRGNWARGTGALCTISATSLKT